MWEFQSVEFGVEAAKVFNGVSEGVQNGGGEGAEGLVPVGGIPRKADADLGRAVTGAGWVYFTVGI